MAADSRVIFSTELDSNGVRNGLNKLEGGLSGLSIGIGTALGNIGATIFSNIVTAVANSYQQWVDTASNLQEVQNVVDTTFGESANIIDDWAKSAKNAYGMSELKAKQYASTLGAMFKSMGLTDTATLKMSQSMAGLAGDMASFYNLDYDTAFEKIRAGISGETEPLKQLGINMSVANLEAYAMSEGIETSYDKMTQAQQATLRYNYILAATADAQGDFARTSDGYANQQRILATTQEELAAVLGEVLIPAATTWTQTLIGMVDGLKTAATWVSNLLHPQKSALDQEIDDAYSATKAFRDEVQQAGNNLTTTLEAAKTTQATALSLLSNYEKIQSKNVLTDADVAQLQTIAQNIITLYPEMSGYIDTNTGYFNDSTTAIRNNINALADQAFASAQVVATQEYTQALMDAAVAEDAAAKAHSDAYAVYQRARGATLVVQSLVDSFDMSTNSVNENAAMYSILDSRLAEYFTTTADGSTVLTEFGESAVQSGGFLDTLNIVLTETASKEDDARKKSVGLYDALLDAQEATQEAKAGVEGANEALLEYKDVISPTTDAQDENTASKWKLTNATGKHTAFLKDNTAAQEENNSAMMEFPEAAGESTNALWDNYEAIEAVSEASNRRGRYGAMARREAYLDAAAEKRVASALKEAKAALEEITASTERNIETTTGGFQKASKIRPVSVKKSISYLKQEIKNLEDYKANLEKAREMGYSDTVLAELSQGTEENAATLAGLVKGKESQVEQINALYESRETAQSTLADDLVAQQASVNDAIAALDESSSAAGESIAGGAETAGDALTTVAEQGKQDASGLSDAATQAQTDADAITNLKATVEGVPDEIKTILTDSEDDVNAAGSQLVEYIASGVKSNNAAKSAVKTSIQTAIDGSKSIASSGGSSLGRNIMAGIQSGLNGASGSLNATMRSIVASLLSAARSAAGVHSPSTLFRDMLGQPIAEGVEVGYTDYMNSSVIPGIAASIREATAAGQSVLDNTILAKVQRITGITGISLPTIKELTNGIMRGSPIAAAAIGGSSVTTVDARQYVTFESTMQAPNEVARAMRRQRQYGLAGAKK